MLSDIAPFRMAGNLYFVGEKRVSSHLIDTGDGLILIDAGYADSAEIIMDSMKILGFDPKNIKIILHSHGHYDHVGGTARLKAISGAETYLHPADRIYLLPEYEADWVPDHDLYDGQVIRLGNTEILCKHTPGHTTGTMSFFFDLQHKDRTYRAATYGGAGVRQVTKPWLTRWNLPADNRRKFFATMAALEQEKVDVFFGNHPWHNHTEERSAAVLAGDEDACIDSTAWSTFLRENTAKLGKTLAKDAQDHFVNYAHRGASEYAPENSVLAFALGLYMGANGIELDLRRTADGVLVIYHDTGLKRRLGIEGKPIDSLTYDELRQYTFTTGDLNDKVLTFEEFCKLFGFQDIHFAVELKAPGIAAETAALLEKYAMKEKTTVTSFELDYLAEMHAVDPTIKLGFLAEEVTEALLEKLRSLGVEELCPKATLVTADAVAAWHRAGFFVRAWGVSNEEKMRRVYDACADGMTVNFPDKLTAYQEACHETN